MSMDTGNRFVIMKKDMSKGSSQSNPLFDIPLFNLEGNQTLPLN